MFARLSTYQGSPIPPGGDIGTHSETIVRQVEDAPGFRGVYYLIDRTSGTAATLSLWEDEESMRASEERATRIREQVAQREGQRIVSVEHFEVGFSLSKP
jgi:heme-degrading monooxygenase HmoA